MAFAPSRPLFVVPSDLDQQQVDLPLVDGVHAHESVGDLAVDVLDRLEDALAAVGLASPSRNSTASKLPVEAPEGTAARPRAPLASSTSTSTVGLPRESRICRPNTPRITVVILLLPWLVIAG